MASHLQELTVNHLYRFGSDSMIKIVSLDGPGWGEVIGPNSGNQKPIPLSPCLYAIGEEIVQQS